MKKILFSLLVLVMAVAVQAQDVKHDGHQKMKRHHDAMAEKLKLTDDQKAKIKTINEEFRTQMAELKKNENITVKEWKSRKEALHKAHQEKMKGVLTDDQKAQLEKMKTERKAMHEADDKARMEKMKIRLGLTDEQAAKMKQNRTEMAEKMKTIRENKSLDATQKKEKMKELMKEQKEKMKTILTEEQLKKLEEGKKQNPDKRQRI